MKDRIETLVIKTDPVLPDWLVDAHLKPEGANDIKITAFYSGNRVKELEKKLEAIGDILDDHELDSSDKNDAISAILESV